MLDPFTGQIFIALFTIFWGIIVESWFVSRWTILFNVVPYLVLLMTFNLGEWANLLGWYVIISILLSLVSGHQGLKQVVGAKGYGALSLALGLVGQENIISNPGTVYVLWFIICIPVYGAWALIRRYKQEYYEYS